jgi:prefoldin subunit 5
MTFQERIEQLARKRTQLQAEILRVEGAIAVLEQLKDEATPDE